MSVSSSRYGITSLPRSKNYKGPFGRLFRELPPWRSPHGDDATAVAALRDFATNEMSETAGQDNLDNANLPAGYTYFGQFVDHDITFDPTSSLMRQSDPEKLENFRTPRLDLDCLYGEGPADEPFMYDKNRGGVFLLGTTEKDWTGDKDIAGSKEPDLLRNRQGRAIIGDMRNDENVIVSQFQLAMLRLHNRVMQKLATGDPDDETTEFGFDGERFQEAQRKVRWFYQYVVWNDFIKRLVSDAIWTRVLDKSDNHKFNGTVYDWNYQPFMPVEFSVAAYRFGHSLIRPGYQINVNDDNDTGLGFGKELPIFHPDGPEDDQGDIRHDLRGFRSFPHRHTVQWDWFFDINSGGPFPQPARRIDTKLSSAVFALDEGPAPKPNMLAFLNLLRSMRLELPKGSDVAQRMGLTPHAINDPHEDILWHYILKESQILPANNSGRMLGAVGGTIVAEVFGGLLDGDPMSFVRNMPNWKPNDDADLMSLLDNPAPVNGGDWEVGDLLRASGAPIDANDVANTIANGRN
ncbi:heme peroxidase family protein [uncultured Ruegeria sp.]|uniref:peroxidase family protein n=1 Tax=uncultured Ruegeria sp. TaxID=259304 RepID=UPI00260DEDAC|nr:heme peroxidase family protein [uncultured Ruegeria sp.]